MKKKKENTEIILSLNDLGKRLGLFFADLLAKKWIILSDIEGIGTDVIYSYTEKGIASFRSMGLIMSIILKVDWKEKKIVIPTGYTMEEKSHSVEEFLLLVKEGK